LLSHFHAEEVNVFPAFTRSQPKQARDLLDEHARIREQLTELGIELDLHCLGADRIERFVADLRAHAATEETTLYRWAAEHLGATEQDQCRRGLTTIGTWRIDPARSSLDFTLRHIVVHQIRGSFTRWGGTVSIDENALLRSTVRVWVDLASIETGDTERDDHVRSSEFFAVEAFPRATFVSRGIRDSGQTNAAIRGRLNLHGNEAEVDLQVAECESSADPQGAERLIYSVEGRIDRRQFGLRWNQDLDIGGVVVGDEIQIVSHVELVRSSS
jgi:polyisoprenoid-binding protein YceI